MDIPGTARIPERSEVVRQSLVHDPDRVELKRAFEDLAPGRYTRHEVIARAIAAGLRSRKGLTLSPQSFGQMMRPDLHQ
jgi:hypothetical protein